MASEPMLDRSHTEVKKHIHLLQDAGLVDARFGSKHHAKLKQLDKGYVLQGQGQLSISAVHHSYDIAMLSRS
jgi:hypothetical protein